jgi:predicted nucleic acid-binding protein
MKILDTNLWVFGTLGTHDYAERLLDEIERGETTSAINAYVVQEALNAFDRTAGLSPAERDEVKTLFLTRLSRMTGLVEAPSSRDFADDLLAERRSASKTRLLGRVLDTQPKDVPILVLTFEHETRQPTILTNDESFAALQPAEYGLDSITLEYAP